MASKPIWSYPVSSLTEELVRERVAQGLDESQRLDFKRDAYAKTERGRKDVRKHVCAMVNGGGGLLLVGVDEENERATRVVGVDDGRAHATWIENTVHGGLEPRLVGLDTAVIEVADGRSLIAVRCPPSSRLPHGFAVNHHPRYFRRNGTSNDPMSDRDIKELHRRSLAALREQRAGWDDALERIRERRGSALTLVLSIIPTGVVGELVDIHDRELRRLLGKPKEGQPPGWGSLAPVAEYGVLGYHRVAASSLGLSVEPAENPWHVDVGRDARITLWTGELRPREGSSRDTTIEPWALCMFPVGFGALARATYAHVGIPGPYALSIALLGVAGQTLIHPPRTGALKPFEGPRELKPDRPDILPPDLEVADLAGGSEPFYDLLERVYNAFGEDHPPDRLFDRDGRALFGGNES